MEREERLERFLPAVDLLRLTRARELEVREHQEGDDQHDNGDEHLEPVEHVLRHVLGADGEQPRRAEVAPRRHREVHRDDQQLGGDRAERDAPREAVPAAPPPAVDARAAAHLRIVREHDELAARWGRVAPRHEELQQHALAAARHAALLHVGERQRVDQVGGVPAPSAEHDQAHEAEPRAHDREAVAQPHRRQHEHLLQRELARPVLAVSVARASPAATRAPPRFDARGSRPAAARRRSTGT